MIRSLILSLFVLGISLGCSKSKKSIEDNEKTTVQTISKADTMAWVGEYVGTVPSSKDIGLEMKLMLNPSNTYSLQITHLRKNPKDNEVKEFKGDVQWEDDSTTIVLNELDSMSNKFKIKPGEVLYLNPDATPNTGKLAEFYALKKK